jgi:hypothetical protein
MVEIVYRIAGHPKPFHERLVSSSPMKVRAA